MKAFWHGITLHLGSDAAKLRAERQRQASCLLSLQTSASEGEPSSSRSAPGADIILVAAHAGRRSSRKGSAPVPVVLGWWQGMVHTLLTSLPKSCFTESHRNIEWFGLEGAFKARLVQHPAMGRDSFHQTSLLKAPSNLALNTAREGAATAFWATCSRVSSPSSYRESEKLLQFQFGKRGKATCLQCHQKCLNISAWLKWRVLSHTAAAGDVKAVQLPWKAVLMDSPCAGNTMWRWISSKRSCAPGLRNPDSHLVQCKLAHSRTLEISEESSFWPLRGQNFSF